LDQLRAFDIICLLNLRKHGASACLITSVTSKKRQQQQHTHYISHLEQAITANSSLVVAFLYPTFVA
jgi:hypothetical protein